MKNTQNLSQYRKNYFSQSGEDGILEALVSLAGIREGYLVEIGAWNGKYLSNIHHLAQKNEAFKTVRVEGLKERFDELVKNVPWNQNNILLNIMVVPEEKEADGHMRKTLNGIFSQYDVRDIAVLSLDTDGPDYDIWKSLNLKYFRPAIVVIEFGEWADQVKLRNFESSFRMKGYNLVHVTGNFIFMDKKYGIKATEPINTLIKKSGNPELMLHFGQINQERHDELEKQLPGTTLHAELAGEQLVEIEEAE